MSDGYEVDNELTVWSCKIGYHPRAELPHGSDAPMRSAAFAAFRDLAGVEADFCFSGWGAELTEGEKAVHEDREPVYERTEFGQRQILLDALDLAWTIIANAGGGDWSNESDEWREAAGRWRDEQFHPLLAEPARD